MDHSERTKATMRHANTTTGSLVQGAVINAALLGTWLGALGAWARWCEHRQHEG
jgi:hypothetical protein